MPPADGVEELAYLSSRRRVVRPHPDRFSAMRFRRCRKRGTQGTLWAVGRKILFRTDATGDPALRTTYSSSPEDRRTRGRIDLQLWSRSGCPLRTASNSGGNALTMTPPAGRVTATRLFWAFVSGKLRRRDPNRVVADARHV